MSRFRLAVLAAALVTGVPLFALQDKEAPKQDKPKESRTAYLRRIFEKDRASYGDACRAVLSVIKNDHSDADYDHKVIDRLGALHERVEPILDAFAAEVPRLSRHNDRLNAAVDRVFAGEKDYVSGVRVDSYHTVWFELHEDLLRILDTERDE